MNWKQLYNSTTQDERYQMIERMLIALESRQHRMVFTGNRWVRNRRRGYQAHFLNDRRDGRHDLIRMFSLLTFGVVLITVSAATWLIVIVVPIQVGLPMLFFHATALLGVLAFKPYKFVKPVQNNQ